MEKEQETAYEDQTGAQDQPMNQTETEEQTASGAECQASGSETDQPEKSETAETETGAETEKPEGQEASEQEDAGEASEKKEEETSDGKWNFFNKKKKDPKDLQIEELTDRNRRIMAEFDNFRKRTEKEKSAMFEIGAKDIIERILPVIDNFERGLSSMPEDVKGTPFANGMEMIYKQLLKNLEDAGVKPIQAEGQPFDPNFHNAVMHVEDENLGENVVAQELQKGYMYRDSVVRHSMVQVAN